jgi:hypothetical protein
MPDGSRCFVVPLLVGWIADYQETCALLNVRGYPSSLPDPNYLVRKTQLNNVVDEFLPRTKKHHDKARRRRKHNTRFAFRLLLTSTSGSHD